MDIARSLKAINEHDQHLTVWAVCVCACVCTRACWDVMLCGTLGFKYDFARSQIKVTCERTRSYTLCVSARARARVLVCMCVCTEYWNSPHPSQKEKEEENRR